MALLGEKLGMTRVEVKKSELVDQLKKNRTQHLKDYEDAMEEYNFQYSEELKKVSAEMKKTANKLSKIADKEDPSEYEKPSLYFSINLEKPVSHLENYDRQIAMREASVQETVVLTEEEFDQYWLVNWSWKENFKQVTTSYKTSYALRNS